MTCVLQMQLDSDEMYSTLDRGNPAANSVGDTSNNDADFGDGGGSYAY